MQQTPQRTGARTIGAFRSGLLTIGLLAALGSARSFADDAGATTFEGEIVAPPLVEQGVPFEATIVRHTEKGPVPLAPGEKVRYRDRDLEVGPDDAQKKLIEGH